MPLMDTISTRHQELLDACSVGMLENHEEVVRFVREVALTGAHVSDVRQRAHLRSFIRFWSSFLYEQTGQFQDFALLPSVTIGPTSHQPQSTELSPEFNRDDPNDLATNPFDSPATAFNDGRDTMLRQFGPYKIIEAIGEGGFSKVYKVFDTERKEIVALGCDVEFCSRW